MGALVVSCRFLLSVTSLILLCTYDSRLGIWIGRRFAHPGCVCTARSHSWGASSQLSNFYRYILLGRTIRAVFHRINIGPLECNLHQFARTTSAMTIYISKRYPADEYASSTLDSSMDAHPNLISMIYEPVKREYSTTSSISNSTLSWNALTTQPPPTPSPGRSSESTPVSKTPPGPDRAYAATTNQRR